jgi:hypothetical protein
VAQDGVRQRSVRARDWPSGFGLLQMIATRRFTQHFGLPCVIPSKQEKIYSSLPLSYSCDTVGLRIQVPPT